MNNQISKSILQRAEVWLNGNYDEITKSNVQQLIDNNPDELTDAFYRDLEFGTGGLRGIMGVGTNRMNKYTVGMATQGLANYLKQQLYINSELRTLNSELTVAIAYDSRNNSKIFAEISANVLSGNGIKVYLFDDIRPTPELSFSIRHLRCNAGIVITASHNPKEYNGYKVYWNDGGQLVNPHDKNVINEVLKIKDIANVKFTGDTKLIEIIGSNIDSEYLKKLKSLSLLQSSIFNLQSSIKIVYTPLHGSGVKLVPMGLRAFGFENITMVNEQAIADGNFPTIKSPNPEEPAAFEIAIKKAKEIDADLILATDPDTDRVGVAVKSDKSDKSYESDKYILLNGNQTASVIIYYLLSKWKENGKFKGKEYIVSTIVTTELLNAIAAKYNVEYIEVLTGFKYIAEAIRLNEGKKTFIGGGEESYGYLIGDFVRDKDAVISCCIIAEAAAYAAQQGKTLLGLLKDIYVEFGFYKEKLISVEKKGISGLEEIKKLMENYRENPPQTINGSKVILIKDYLQSSIQHPASSIQLPKSDVLQFFLEDGSKISVRPSGTEPKIKYYFGVKAELKDSSQYSEVSNQLDAKIDSIIKDMKL